MAKGFLSRNTFSEETPRMKPNSLKTMKICQSKNFMQMILGLKMQSDIQAKYSSHIMTNKPRLAQEENNFSGSGEDQSFDIENKNVQNIVFGRRILSKRKSQLISQIIDDKDEEEIKQYPQLLEMILLNFVKKAKHVKSEIKRIKGLPVDKQFVPVNSHVCEYCGKIFPKPCSLGGHISKLHFQQRRRDKENEELKVAKSKN